MKTNNLAGCDESPPVFFQNIRGIASSAILAIGCQVVSGQDLPFDSGSTGTDGPGPFAHINIPLPQGYDFQGQGMVFDEARNVMTVFGAAQGGTMLDKVWRLQGGDWFQASVSPAPPYRVVPAMAFDTARQKVVMFGGRNSSGVYLDDTWLWDGTNWIQRIPSNAPSPRARHAMAYDTTHHEVVLFGGIGSAWMYDTWTWDGTNWNQKTNVVSPDVVYPVLCNDEARSEIILYGGCQSGGSCSSRTWAWDGSNWTQRSSPTSPSPRTLCSLVYDRARQNCLLFGGENGQPHFKDTWIWDGATWRQADAGQGMLVSNNSYSLMAYDPRSSSVILAGGQQLIGGQGYQIYDTLAWNGTNWSYMSGSAQTFDCGTNTNGLWNFTSINVPSGLIVLFKNGRVNKPVRWLASSAVSIAGTLDLSGQPGFPSGLGFGPAGGGPGGFSGGVGGTPTFQGGSPDGGSGQGPGGGLPGLTSGLPGQAGAYASSYGNSFIVPLIGGSGGGGSAANGGSFGNSGGGGGGAILIASSRDMTITGSIRANGGAGYSGSGAGSGGAIRLRADRITMGFSARLEATNDGRIRLESYERAISGAILPTNVLNTAISGLVTNLPASEPTLLIASVAGQNVQQPPGGDLLNPDVIFTGAGQITVSILAQNVPDGTPVRLRVAMTGNVINKPATGEPPVVLAGGTASFTLLVPKGRGTIQALADFATGN